MGWPNTNVTSEMLSPTEADTLAALPVNEFCDLTRTGFAMRAVTGSDFSFMFESPARARIEVQKLRDFRLRLLVDCAMNLAEVVGGGRYTGKGFDNWGFKVRPVPGSFIITVWQIHLTQFNEYAIHKTMRSDDGKHLSQTFRSDETFSIEEPLSLGTY